MTTDNLSKNEVGNLNPPGFVNKAYVAKWLGVSQRTVDDYMRRGLIVYYKIGRTVRFKLDDLEAYLRQTCRVTGGAGSL